jgi:formylglycine-generating enzyme required for sulfatase activity
MVTVAGGRFSMGSPKGEVGHDEDEGPSLDLTMPSFRIDRTPVTAASFTKVMAEIEALDPLAKWTVESETPHTWPGKCNLGSSRTEHPANCVTWRAARAYCHLRGADLPTEAEWEYATRASSTTAYWWGAAYEGGHSVDSVQCNKRACRKSTEPVVITGPRCNALGICDLTGNIWQWTQTEYHERLDASVQTVSTKIIAKPVHRGGAWLDNVQTLLRSAQRGLNYPEHGLTGVGFRCVMR